MPNDWLKYLTATAKVFAVAVLLGESFAGADRLLTKTGLESGPYAFFVGPAFTHFVILLTCLIFLHQPKLNLPLEKRGLWLALSGPGWLALASCGAWLTSSFFPGTNILTSVSSDATWWISTVLVAPILEELVYRGLISPIFRRDCGNLAGSYFAAVLFAWVHAKPTIAGLLAGHAGGVPPGPLLLALIADGLYLRSGSLWVAVAFHAACNATPAAFNAIDPRWLNWLGMLYQWGP